MTSGSAVWLAVAAGIGKRLSHPSPKDIRDSLKNIRDYYKNIHDNPEEIQDSPRKSG